MARTRTESVVINTGANVAARLVTQLMKSVLRVIFIRTLGIEYASISALFGDVLSMLALAELGIGNAIAFALYKPLKDNDHERIAALMGFYKKAYRLVAGFVALAGLACLPFLPMMLKEPPDIPESIYAIFLLLVADSACSYLFSYKSTLLSAGQKRYYISLVGVIFNLVQTGAQFVLLLVFRNYILYLVVGIAGTLLRNFVISMVADRCYPDVKTFAKTKLDKDEIKRLMRDVYALALYRINGTILTSSDSIIISSTIEKGRYSVGYLRNYRDIINIIDSFVQQFYTAALPSLGNLAAGASEKKQFSVFKMMFFITFWCNCFCTTSMFVLSDPFIQTVLGKSFMQPTIILIALLLDNYLVGMMRVVSTFRNANGLFIQGKYRPVATSLLNIILSLALAKPLGVFGVLIATSIARLLTTFWFEPRLVYTNVFRVPIIDYVKRYALYGLITLACCAATHYLGNAVHTGSGYLDFLYKMALCVLIPNGLIVLCFRKTEEYHGFMIRLGDSLSKTRSSIQRKLNRGA